MEENQMEKSLHDLVEIIHFTENVSTRIHGVLDEDKIYEIIKEESAHSVYTVSILLLKDDKSSLKIVEAPLSTQKVKAAEKATGFNLKTFTLDLEKSTIYRQVVKEGKTVQVHVDDILTELFPRSIASIISTMLNYKEKSSILTPLKRNGEIIGALAMSSTEFAEYFIPSVKNLAQHISTALELSDEYNERKKVEKDLKEAEKKFRDLFDSASDAIAIQDLKGHFLEVNRTLCQRLKYTKQELLQLTETDIVSPAYALLIPKRIEALKEKGFLFFETAHITKNGDTIPLEVNSRVIEYQGQPAILSIARDITERKQAEAKLQETEEKFRHLVENINDVIYAADKTGVVTYVSPAIESFIGYLPEEVYGHHFSEFVCKEDLPRLKEQFEKILSGHETANEYRVVSKSGDIRWMYTSSRPVFTEEGVAGVQGALLDITERKKAEEQLRKSEEKFRVLFENQGIGMVMGELHMPLTGEIHPVEFNAAVLKFFGYTKEEFRTKTMADVSHPEDLEKDIAILNEMLAHNRNSFEREKRFIRKDGQVVWGSLTASFLRDAEGNPTHIIASVQDITEQKRSEEALRKSEEEFRLAFENAKDAIFWADPETGLIIKCNKAAETLLEKKRADIIGHHHTELHPPEAAAYYKEVFKHHAEQKETEGIKTDVFTASGKIIPVHILASLTKVGGKPILQGIFRDITESKRAEEKLRESEEKFRGIAERIFDAIFELDIEGCITYMSPAIERITGYNPQEMVGTPFLTYVSGPDVPRSRQTYINLLKGKTLENFQVKVLKKDGSSALLELNVSPVIKEGIITGVQGIARDITERKKAEMELRESEEKYRTLVEQSLQGILIIQGTPPRLVFANSALAEMSGYTVEEMLSLPPESMRTVIHPEDQVVFKRYMARLAGESAPPRYEFRIIRKDGEMRWMELHASRIEYQEEPAVQVVLMDITERKKAEEQIKQSLKEKEVLLREIHHRVKNNLQVISSLLNLQSEHAGDARYTEMLKESQNRIRSMALIHEKLYQSENVADIDLDEYITALVAGLVRSYRVSTNNITVAVNVGDVSLGMDTAIPCGLIINELVSNSLKHAFPDGEGEITVELHARDRTIELTVADNGVGIPDIIDFKNTETLGLDLVTILAEEQLNGSITLDKTKGTAFCITFREVVS